MVDIKRYFFELRTHWVIRDRRQVHHCVNSFQHEIRNISDVSEILVIQLALRQEVCTCKAACKETSIVSDESSLGICFPKSRDNSRADIAHVTEDGDFHMCLLTDF